MLFPVVKDLDINVLCSLGKTLKPEDLGEIPANVTTMAFTPQMDEQITTARRARELGVASSVMLKDEVTEEKLREAL